MGKLPIAFVILACLLSMFLGAALGSLLEQVFGFGWLNVELFGSPVTIEDFYLLKRLELQLTPGALLGLGLAGWFFYRYTRN
ncbi:MAG: hypothetical protein K1X75_05280 [Leptospirales bacterium]|nr:hypothetical protein [Leptospirales bacterium]